MVIDSCMHNGDAAPIEEVFDCADQTRMRDSFAPDSFAHATGVAPIITRPDGPFIQSCRSGWPRDAGARTTVNARLQYWISAPATVHIFSWGTK